MQLFRINLENLKAKIYALVIAYKLTIKFKKIDSVKRNVYVKYVTEDGKELEAEKEVLVNEKVGTKYTTEQKTFDGYEFVELTKNSALENGTVQEGVPQVTYVYKKKEVTSPVGEGHKVTHYLKSSTHGKELAEEVKTLLPDNQTRKADGTTAVPTEPNPTQVTTADGKWTFEGYDEK